MTCKKTGRGILSVTLLALLFFSGCSGPQDPSPEELDREEPGQEEPGEEDSGSSLVNTISVDADIRYGEITVVPARAAKGRRVIVQADPDSNYQLVAGSLKYNDTVISGPPYAFIMPAGAVTVTAEFEKIPPKTVYAAGTESQTGHGGIALSPGPYYNGSIVTVTVTPDSGWQLQAGTLKVNDGDVELSGGGPEYTFRMPRGHVTVSADFEQIPVPVTDVKVTPSIAELAAGAEFPLTAVIAPSDASEQTVTWTSSDETVARVSPDGVVTVDAGAAEGSSAAITATTADGSFTDDCVVTVKAGAGFVFGFTGFGDEVIDLTKSTEADLSKSNYDILTVTYNGSDSDDVVWFLDGQSHYADGTYYAYASSISLGVHYLSAVIQNGSKYASKEVSFRVVE